MMIFLRGKLLDFIVLDKTYNIPAEIHTLMVTDAGAKARYEANAKAVDHLVRSLCDPEFERVHHLNLAWKIWEKLLVAHGGDNHVKALLFVSYRMQYENFTQLPGENIDAMFQRFTAIVNNMKANVEDFPYTEHDQALKLLHILGPNVWGAKVEAIKVLTQNPHPASSTQQAEKAMFTREQTPRCASQFSLKINKRQSS
jgi:hypothetical protein